MTEVKKYRFKISVVGDLQVGKTSLMKKFTNGDFSEEYAKTIGAQFSKYDMEIDGNPIRLMFYDIAAEDVFHYLYPTFFRETSAAIIVFSLEDTELGEESFNHIPDWHEEIVKYCGDVPIYIFANKVDLVDENEFDEAIIKRLVEEVNFHDYYYTSVVAEYSVMKAFNDIGMALYNKSKALTPPEPKFVVRANKRKKRRRNKRGKI